MLEAPGGLTQGRGAARPTGPCPKPSVTIFTSFKQAEASWRDLEGKAACHVFQTFDWLHMWRQTMGKDAEPQIVMMTDAAGAPQLLLPLSLERRRGLRILRFMGGIVTDYNAPVLCRGLGASIDALWPSVLDALPPADLVWFEKMPLEVDGVPNPCLALPGCRPSENAHELRLGATYEDYKARHDAAFFRDTRRKRRRLSELGSICCRVARPEDVGAMMSAVVRQKVERWRKTGHRDLSGVAGLWAFYEALARSSLGHLSALYVDDEIVAAHLGVFFRGRLYFLLPCFAGGVWRKYSPGRLHLEELILWGYANDVAVVDLTIGDEPYKLQWCDNITPLYECLMPLTWRGRAFRRLVTLLRAAKQQGFLRRGARIARSLAGRVRQAR